MNITVRPRNNHLPGVCCKDLQYEAEIVFGRCGEIFVAVISAGWLFSWGFEDGSGAIAGLYKFGCDCSWEYGVGLGGSVLGD